MDLKDGEIICPRCKGNGEIMGCTCMVLCPKCKGKKKLDWVENATGVKDDIFDYPHNIKRGNNGT